jgi:hypothetical protein
MSAYNTGIQIIAKSGVYLGLAETAKASPENRFTKLLRRVFANKNNRTRMVEDYYGNRFPGWVLLGNSPRLEEKQYDAEPARKVGLAPFVPDNFHTIINGTFQPKRFPAGAGAAPILSAEDINQPMQFPEGAAQYLLEEQRITVKWMETHYPESLTNRSA